MFKRLGRQKSRVLGRTKAGTDCEIKESTERNMSLLAKLRRNLQQNCFLKVFKDSGG